MFNHIKEQWRLLLLTDSYNPPTRVSSSSWHQKYANQSSQQSLVSKGNKIQFIIVLLDFIPKPPTRFLIFQDIGKTPTSINAASFVKCGKSFLLLSFFFFFLLVHQILFFISNRIFEMIWRKDQTFIFLHSPCFSDERETILMDGCGLYFQPNEFAVKVEPRERWPPKEKRRYQITRITKVSSPSPYNQINLCFSLTQWKMTDCYLSIPLVYFRRLLIMICIETRHFTITLF